MKTSNNTRLDLSTLSNMMLQKRTSTGETQAEVAKKIGLARQTYSRAERNDTYIELDTVLAICDWIDIPITYFILDPNREIKAEIYHLEEEIKQRQDKIEELKLKLKK